MNVSETCDQSLPLAVNIDVWDDRLATQSRWFVAGRHVLARQCCSRHCGGLVCCT